MNDISISSFSISSALRQSILTAQSNLSDTEVEVSTGRYADVGRTLGAEAGESVSLRQEGSLLQTITNSNNLISTRLSTTQNVLSELASSAQNFLNSLIAVDNSTANAGSLQSSAKTSLNDLTTSLNSSFDGGYLFAGINTSNAPITDYYGTSAPNAQAVDNAFSAAFGMTQSSANVSSISGTAMQNFLNGQFASLFQGTNWASDWSSATDQVQTTQISATETVATSVSANQNAFKELASAYTMVANLGTQNLNSDAYAAVMSTAQSTMSKAINDLTDLQANVGTVQSSISSANDQMSLEMNYLTTQVNNLESVDPAEASTRVTALQTQIETAYSLTAQLHSMSLVNYL